MHHIYIYIYIYIIFIDSTKLLSLIRKLHKYSCERALATELILISNRRY